MSTVLLPPDGYPIAVNKYIISHSFSEEITPWQLLNRSTRRDVVFFREGKAFLCAYSSLTEGVFLFQLYSKAGTQLDELCGLQQTAVLLAIYKHMYRERVCVCTAVTLSELKRVGNWVTDWSTVSIFPRSTLWHACSCLHTHSYLVILINEFWFLLKS
jgi:hypothetical protein